MLNLKLGNRIKGGLVVCLVLIIALVSSTEHVHAVGKTASAAKKGANYDVVVIGSEIQGVLLARAAKKEGKRVLILDPREKPGGELIQGQMMVLDQPNNKQKKSLVQGELKTLFQEYKAGRIRTQKEFDRYFQKLLKGLSIHSGITVTKVDYQKIADYNSIQSLTYQDRKGIAHTVTADYWVENTDFNALVSKLGDKQRIAGMETISKAKQADYMAATYMLKFKNVNWSKLHADILKLYPVTNLQEKMGPNTYVDWNFGTGFSNVTSKYKSQDKQLMLRGLNMTYQKWGQVLINALLIYDVDPSSPQSVKQAIDKGKHEAPHILAFLRANIPGFEKAELNGFPEYLYIRDYNRYETDYMLNESDLLNSRMFWDNVSIGGYPMDLQGTQTMPWGKGFGHTDQYGIPMRSFLLKSYDNVIMAGKNIGATIQAYGSARIMPNNGLAAETIGIIIGREAAKKKLRDLTPTDFTRIHQYLKKDYGIALAG